MNDKLTPEKAEDILKNHPELIKREEGQKYTVQELLDAMEDLKEKKLYTREEMFEATYEAYIKGTSFEPKDKFTSYQAWFDKKFPI